MFNNKEYVIAVEKSKSFSKAAKELYISQPSLSASIKRIEKEIGAPLFDRSTSPLSLTEIGEKYIECANEVANIEENFKNYVGDNINMLAGGIKIGGSSMFNSFVLSGLISDFNKEYPQIEFSILEEHSQNLINMIIDGKLDIAIDNVPVSNKSVNQINLTSEIILLAVPASFEINTRLKDKVMTAEDIKAGKHTADSSPTVALKEFECEPFVLLKSENDTGKRAAKLFKKHDIKPQVKFRLDQQMTAYNFTFSGVGVSFVSDTLVKHLSPAPDVLYYKLDDEEIKRDIFFYVKSNRYLTNACKLFIEESVKNIK